MFFAARKAFFKRSVYPYLSKPQFSQFFGFSDEGEATKGVDYRIWRYEVESALSVGLHSEGVIVKQIRSSLHGEAKYKMVGFGPGASAFTILQSLDQFYSHNLWSRCCMCRGTWGKMFLS